MRRGFAILDFETTGLSPNRGDRVLELGALYMTPDLRLDGGLETIIDPCRDVGPTRIHGLTATDVLGAPTFDQVAPMLLDMLDGRVIVGHNVAFDLRFLEAELKREGYDVPAFVAIDTIHLSRLLLQSVPRSMKLHDVGAHLGITLAAVCEFVKLEPREEHSALGDALVTSFLLSHFAGLTAQSGYWNQVLNRAEDVVWPERYPARVEARLRTDRFSPAATGAHSVLEVMRAVGAVLSPPASTAQYSDVLASAMADRILDSAEVDALVESARTLGLDAATLGSLHRGYFDELVQRAWSDGELSPQESEDLARVAGMLGIDPDSLLSATAITASASRPQLPIGSQIVLTGDMSAPREELEREIVRLGFVPGRSVTKATAVVIAADANTQSGKAKRARGLGIPVIDEAPGFALLRETNASAASI